MDDYLVVLLCIIFSAFFSGIEIALLSSNKLQIEVDKNKGLFSAKLISKFIQNPSKLIVAILLGNNIALVIYGISAANILDPWILSWLPQALNNHYILLSIQTLLATGIILIFAEFTPKILFRINANKILSFFAPVITFIYYLIYPLVLLFTKASDFLFKYIFRTKQQIKTTKNFTPIDLDYYLSEYTSSSSGENDISQEIMMVQNAMDLKNVKIRECMRPRNEIVSAEFTSSIEELKEKFISSGFSKIPIYKNNIDNVIGYVHAYDLFQKPDSIKNIIKSIMIVPETMLADKLLKELIDKRKSIAVVVDEFGGTSGIITLEDLAEEIFGEIEDEFDVDDSFEKKLSENSYIFSARAEIDYLNETYELNLPESEEYKTLSGLIIHYHANIPVKNEEIIIGSFSFKILQASDTKIEKVLLRITDNKE